MTAGAIAGVVLLYEVGGFDPRDPESELPVAGTRYPFTATAYCKGTTTASGVSVQTGIAASDPGVLPVGSVISIAASDAKYSGVYIVMDTGPNVRGHLVDLYMWSCTEALAFGRQPIELTVLRLGWDPGASTPGLIDRLFRRRNTTRTAAPARPPAAPNTGAEGVDGDNGASRASESADGANGANIPGPPPAPSNPAPSDAPFAPPAPLAPLPPVTLPAPAAPAVIAPRSRRGASRRIARGGQAPLRRRGGRLQHVSVSRPRGEKLQPVEPLVNAARREQFLMRS